MTTQQNGTPDTNTRIAEDRLLAKIGQGRHIEDVYDKIEEVARRVRQTGNPGTVTVKYKITSPSVGQPSVNVVANITQSMPATTPEGATVFVDGEIGGLHV